MLVNRDLEWLRDCPLLHRDALLPFSMLNSFFHFGFTPLSSSDSIARILPGYVICHILPLNTINTGPASRSRLSLRIVAYNWISS